MHRWRLSLVRRLLVRDTGKHMPLARWPYAPLEKLSRVSEPAFARRLSLALRQPLQVLRLMKRREKWLVLVALRFLRTCIGLKVCTRLAFEPLSSKN